MASSLYSNARAMFLNGTLNWLTDDIKVMIVSGAYTFDVDHSLLSDIPSGNIVATSTSLTGKTITDGAADAADIAISNVTGSVIAAIIVFKDMGSPSVSKLIAYIDTGTGFPATPDGSNVAITWDSGANKIFRL